MKNVLSHGADCFKYVFIDTHYLVQVHRLSITDQINQWQVGEEYQKLKHKQSFKVGQCQMSFTYGILMNRETECKNKITEKNKSCKKKKEKKNNHFHSYVIIS